MPSYKFTKGPKRRQHDEYPSLRRRGVPTDLRRLPRRDRVISKALHRAVRRWDTYAGVVRAGELDGDASAKTPEWRLIVQNGRLLKRLRGLDDYVMERSERLATPGSDPIQLPTLPLHRRVPKGQRSGISNRPSKKVPGLWSI